MNLNRALKAVLYSGTILAGTSAGSINARAKAQQFAAGNAG